MSRASQRGVLLVACVLAGCGGRGISKGPGSGPDAGAGGMNVDAGFTFPGPRGGAGGAAGAGGMGGSGTNGGGAGGATDGPIAGATVTTNYPCMGCDKFPAPGAMACAEAALPAPTIAYPPDGVLLPPNMHVLEVQFVPNSDAKLFEVDFTNATTRVTVEAPCQPVPDVRGGASRGCGVTLPQAAWNDIANHNRDGDSVEITVRATKDGSCVATSKTSIHVSFAKEDLAGGIYYWQAGTYGGIAGKTGGIYSHDFGTFDPNPTPFLTAGATGTCIGCHTLSRDGLRMAFMSDDPDADDEMGDVKMHVMDVGARTVLTDSKAPPPPKGAGPAAVLGPGFQTFSHDHSRMIASTWKTNKNLSFAIFDGDGRQFLANATIGAGLAGTHPDLSPDDKTLAFVVPRAMTISPEGDHHFLGGSIYTAAFDVAANTLGAPAAVLQAQAGQTFYYPSFAPGGAFLVLNAVTDGTATEDAFYHRRARVALLRSPGGKSLVELPALNAAALGNKLSNSWPKWSPFVQQYRGHKLLWVTFSSNRDYGLHLANGMFDNCYPPESPMYDQPQPLSKQGVTYSSCAQPQIWMAAIIVDEDPAMDAKDRSFPAFWLPFQDVNAHNHTAQWVEKIVGTPTPPPSMQDGGVPPTDDGGAPPPQDAGPAPMCVAKGGACGPNVGMCCSDVVCVDSVCAELIP